MSKVSKARYYPNGHFLAASVGHNPSYVWRSVCQSQVALREGVRWCVGDGASIKVLGNPWLHSGNGGITLSINIELNNLLVKDLVLPRTTIWNMQFLRGLFSTQVIDEITKVPLIHVVDTYRLV